MTIEIDLWQVICSLAGGLATFAGVAVAFGRMLLTQIDQRLDQRFRLVEDGATEWRGIERDLLAWKAEMPLQYVRREDYVRNQTVIEAKLDALAMRLENHQLRGEKS